MWNEHFHIWRMSETCTEWFFTREWLRIGTEASIPNQFDTLRIAEALTDLGDSERLGRRRYMVLQCDEESCCPMVHGR